MIRPEWIYDLFEGVGESVRSSDVPQGEQFRLQARSASLDGAAHQPPGCDSDVIRWPRPRWRPAPHDTRRLFDAGDPVRMRNQNRVRVLIHLRFEMHLTNPKRHLAFEIILELQRLDILRRIWRRIRWL